MGNVIFLGVEGAGKSSLTAALATYFSECKERGWSLRPENKEAFAFSTRMPKRFAGGEFPAQTATFRHLQWSICYKDEPQRTLDVLDYPGEIYRLAFLDPSDDTNPANLQARQQAHASEIRELMGFLKHADQVFVLFNINDAKNLDTDNENIDAVWVTFSAIKILSSLENKPDLTLLITQADRLADEGETVEDVDAIVDKYLPIIGQRFKGLKKLAISAKDYNNAQYGLLPLATALLTNTELYKIAVPKWCECENEINNGITDKWAFDRALDKYNQFSLSAEAFEWVSFAAKDFINLSAPKGLLEEYQTVIDKCRETETQNIGFKMKIEALANLKKSIQFKCCATYIDQYISRLDSDRTTTQIVFTLLLFFLSLMVLLGFFASISQK